MSDPVRVYYMVTLASIDDEIFSNSIQDNGYSLRQISNTTTSLAMLKYYVKNVPVKLTTTRYIQYSHQEILDHINVTANGWEI